MYRQYDTVLIKRRGGSHLVGTGAMLQQRLEDAIAGWRVWAQGIEKPLQRYQDLRQKASSSIYKDAISLSRLQGSWPLQSQQEKVAVLLHSI